MILSLFTRSYTHDTDILSIGIKTASGEHKLWNSWDFSSEQEMLENFISYFLETTDKIVIGFNNLKFDLPLLLLKTAGLTSFPEFFKKVNYSNIEDLFVVLTFQNKGRFKTIDQHAKEFELATHVIAHQEWLRAYDAQEKEKVVVYSKQKLDVIDEMVKKMWYHD